MYVYVDVDVYVYVFDVRRLQFGASEGNKDMVREAREMGGDVNTPDTGPILKEGEKPSNDAYTNIITGDYPLHMAAGTQHSTTHKQTIQPTTHQYQHGQHRLSLPLPLSSRANSIVTFDLICTYATVVARVCCVCCAANGHTEMVTFLFHLDSNLENKNK